MSRAAALRRLIEEARPHSSAGSRPSKAVQGTPVGRLADRMAAAAAARDARKDAPAPQPGRDRGRLVQAAHPLGDFASFVGRLTVLLLILGFILADRWSTSARWQAAGTITTTICAQRPQPHACQADGHPTDFFSAWLRAVG